MKKQSKFLCIMLLAMFAIKCPTKAQVLVSTGFDNGYTTGALNGQSTSGDVGLSGTWSSNSGAYVVAATGVNDLTYNVAGGGTISSGSNVLQYTKLPSDGANGEVPITGLLNTPISGQNVYMRLVISAPIASSGISTDLDFYANNTLSGQYGKIQGTGLGQFGNNTSITSGGFAGAGTGSGYGGNVTGLSTTVLTSAPTLLVAEFIWDAAAGGYDSTALWVDPSATMGAPDATATLNLATGTPTPSIDEIGLADANLGTGPTYDFDSVVIGTTWADVVPQAQAVPEPSTWAFLVAGLAALFPVLRRRFKMNN